MTRIVFEDPRADPSAFAARLNISREAVDLYLASDVIDLHLDSFIWPRVFGYDLLKTHGGGLFGGRFYSQTDLPRILACGMTGAMWSITTNPWRSRAGRARTFARNLERLERLFASVSEQFRLVRNEREYRAARVAGQHGVFVAIQGGNAVDADFGALADERITRVTLVHLTNSSFGSTSSPLRLASDEGLRPHGRAFVEALNAKRIFVDLAHISKRGFAGAAEVHDKTQPLIVTHSGASGVQPSWRNLDDDQIRTVAETGGVIGVVFHGPYLSGQVLSGGPLGSVVDHLAHIVNVGGEDAAALGSDWDGAIIPPRELRSCVGMARLVQAMLDRRFTPTLIQRILGANFLRALRRLRP